MQIKKHKTCVAYYLLGQTTAIRIINKNIVLLTLKGNEYAPNKTVRLLPTSKGLVMRFNRDLTINLNISNALYHEIIDDELISDFDNSPLEFLREALHAGLEDGYTL